MEQVIYKHIAVTGDQVTRYLAGPVNDERMNEQVERTNTERVMNERIINVCLNEAEVEALEVALGYMYNCNVRDINKTKNPDKLRCHKRFNENLVSCITKMGLEEVMMPFVEL